MQTVVKSVLDIQHTKGDEQVSSYAVSKRFHNGCDEHPHLAEHTQIAGELGSFIKRIMKW